MDFLWYLAGILNARFGICTCHIALKGVFQVFSYSNGSTWAPGIYVVSILSHISLSALTILMVFISIISISLVESLN